MIEWKLAKFMPAFSLGRKYGIMKLGTCIRIDSFYLNNSRTKRLHKENI